MTETHLQGPTPYQEDNRYYLYDGTTDCEIGAYKDGYPCKYEENTPEYRLYQKFMNADLVNWKKLDDSSLLMFPCQQHNEYNEYNEYIAISPCRISDDEKTAVQKFRAEHPEVIYEIPGNGWEFVKECSKVPIQFHLYSKENNKFIEINTTTDGNFNFNNIPNDLKEALEGINPKQLKEQQDNLYRSNRPFMNIGDNNQYFLFHPDFMKEIPDRTSDKAFREMIMLEKSGRTEFPKITKPIKNNSHNPLSKSPNSPQTPYLEL